MVYKKYIKKGGRTFGPYYYESYRENGKVKTRFVSGPKKSDKVKESLKENRNYFILGFVFLIVILLFVFVYFFKPELYREGILLSPYEAAKPEEDVGKVDYDMKGVIRERIIEKKIVKEPEKKIRIEKLPDGSLEIYDISEPEEKKVAILKMSEIGGVKRLDIEWIFG